MLVCLITSARDELRYARPRVEPTLESGLLAPSRVMTDKLTAIPRIKLGRRIGRLDAATLAEVERALFIILGLA